MKGSWVSATLMTFQLILEFLCSYLIANLAFRVLIFGIIYSLFLLLLDPGRTCIVICATIRYTAIRKGKLPSPPINLAHSHVRDGL